MPTTGTYGFEYEPLSGDEPGRTLHGGTSGTSPILAEQIDDEFARVDADIQSVQDDVGAATQLIERNRVTSDTDFVDFTVPQTYRNLRLVITGYHNGTGEFELVWLRFNGDSSSNYRNLVAGFDGAGAITPHHNMGANAAEVAYVNSLSPRGSVDILIPEYRDATGGRYLSATAVWSANAGTATGNMRTGTGGALLFTSSGADLAQLRVGVRNELWGAGTTFSLWGIP